MTESRFVHTLLLGLVKLSLVVKVLCVFQRDDIAKWHQKCSVGEENMQIFCCQVCREHTMVYGSIGWHGVGRQVGPPSAYFHWANCCLSRRSCLLLQSDCMLLSSPSVAYRWQATRKGHLWHLGSRLCPHYASSCHWEANSTKLFYKGDREWCWWM